MSANRHVPCASVLLVESRLVCVAVEMGGDEFTYIFETKELVATIRPYRASQIGQVLL